MPTFNSAVYAKQIAPRLGNRVAAPLLTSVVLFAEIAYAMAGTEAANDLINLMKLPLGAKVLPGLCSVTSEGIATTATLDVGDTDDSVAADADRYADGLDIAAAGTDLFSAIAGVAQLTPYTTGKECVLQAKFATLVTPVANKKLLFRIAYLVTA